MAEHVRRKEAVRTMLVSNYAMLGAFVAFGDGRMLYSQYAPDAVLITPDSTRSSYFSVEALKP